MAEEDVVMDTEVMESDTGAMALVVTGMASVGDTISMAVVALDLTDIMDPAEIHSHNSSRGWT